MRRWLAIALLGAVCAAAFGIYYFLPAKTVAESLLSGALGMPVQIESVDVDFGDPLQVRLQGLAVDNPPWASPDKAGRIARLELAVAPWPLLRGDVQLLRLTAEDSRIAIVRDGEGRLNWQPALPAGTAVAPQERTEFPAIGELHLSGLELHVRDAVEDLSLDAEVSLDMPPGDDRMRGELEGTLNGRDMQAGFAVGRPETLRDADKPYPVRLRLRHGSTLAHIDGTVSRPLELRDFDIELRLQGPSMAQVLPELRMPLPRTPPYRLHGRLSRAAQVWRFADFEGWIGDSDMAGTIEVDLSERKPRITGNLRSQRLEFSDLAALVGADPQTGEREPTRGIFPDAPLRVDRMHRADLRISLSADKVRAPNLPISALDATFNLRDGRLLIRPLYLEDGEGGRISGELAVNARTEPPSADIDVVLQQVRLRPFFQDTQFVQEMGGEFTGTIYLLGSGQSLAEMMAQARGRASLGMTGGRISGLLVEAAGVDVAEALLLTVVGDTALAIRCARTDLVVTEGVAHLRRVIVDTTDSTLVARGRVDLGAQTLDLQIEARAKDFSLIDVAAPVRLQGPWQDPDVAIGGLDPLPFLELGQQGNVNCDRLLGDLAGRASSNEPQNGAPAERSGASRP